MVAILWIPAFAGMTEAKTNFETYPCKPMKGEGIRRLGAAAWFQVVRLFADLWIPAFAGMTGGRRERRG